MTLAVYDGELIAGGCFDNGSGLSGIAAWDGSGWHSLGQGIDPNDPG